MLRDLAFALVGGHLAAGSAAADLEDGLFDIRA
jgi:hypothetical protein